MTTKVQQWGNSLAIRIPKILADEMSIGRDAPVEILLRDGELILRPLHERKPTLDDLLSEITESNRHPEMAWSAGDFGTSHRKGVCPSNGQSA